MESCPPRLSKYITAIRFGLKPAVLLDAAALGRCDIHQAGRPRATRMRGTAVSQNRFPPDRAKFRTLAGSDAGLAAATGPLRRLTVCDVLRRARIEREEARRAALPRSTSASASAKSRMVENRSAGVFSRARMIASSTSSGIELRTT